MTRARAQQRWLALILSSVVFFLVSCTAVTRTGMAVLSRDQAKVGDPPWSTVQIVVARPDGQLQITHWFPEETRHAVMAKASPLLPQGSGQLLDGDTTVSFRASEEGLPGPKSQLVEVTVDDAEEPSFFRYRAFADRIEPLYSRIDHQGYLFASLPVGVLVAWLIRALGRAWLKRLDRAAPA